MQLWCYFAWYSWGWCLGEACSLHSTLHYVHFTSYKLLDMHCCLIIIIIAPHPIDVNLQRVPMLPLNRICTMIKCLYLCAYSWHETMPNGISIGPAVFAGYRSWPTHRHTRTQTRLRGSSNRPHLNTMHIRWGQKNCVVTPYVSQHNIFLEKNVLRTDICTTQYFSYANVADEKYE